MSKQEKLIRTIEILLDRHTRMYARHEARRLNNRDAILEADREMIMALEEDLARAEEADNFERLYTKHRRNIEIPEHFLEISA